MIEATHLSKRYGAKLAVDDISFTVRSGQVTGFLGPNGAGKSTTMRMIVGLDAPSGGRVTVGGKQYAEAAAPLREVGILLDAKAVHPGRSARAHLTWLAQTHSIPRSRVEEVIEMTGLGHVAGKRVGAFSLGMGQRLGIAAALLADPEVLILDEPVNGLDPEGVRWVRDLVRDYAAMGRTVFVSSHLMSEMAQTADHVIVLGRGRVLADCPIGQLIAGASNGSLMLRSTQTARLAQLLASPQVTITSGEPEQLFVSGITARQLAEAAAAARIPIYELRDNSASLEDAYLSLTQDAVEFRTDAAHLYPTAIGA